MKLHQLAGDSESYLYSLVGKRIQVARKANGLTQLELGQLINLKRTTITNIETGKQKVSLFNIYQICVVLELELIDLLPSLQIIKKYNFDLLEGRRNQKTEGIIGSKTIASLEHHQKKR